MSSRHSRPHVAPARPERRAALPFIFIIMCGCVLRTEPVVRADAAASQPDASLPDAAAAIDSAAPDDASCIRHAVVATTASADDGNVSDNAVDDDLDTRWAAAGAGQWIAFDLGQSVEVGRVAVAWYRGDERRASFILEVSQDETSWSVTYSGAASGTSLAPESYDFTAQIARHVRIVGQGNDMNDWNSITEVEIYSGCD